MGPATIPVTPVTRMRLPERVTGLIDCLLRAASVVVAPCSRPQSDNASETSIAARARSPHGDRIHARAGGDALRAARLLRQAARSRDGREAVALARHRPRD